MDKNELTVLIENEYGENTEAKVPYRNDTYNCNTDPLIDAEPASPAQTI